MPCDVENLAALGRQSRAGILPQVKVLCRGENYAVLQGFQGTTTQGNLSADSLDIAFDDRDDFSPARAVSCEAFFESDQTQGISIGLLCTQQVCRTCCFGTSRDSTARCRLKSCTSSESQTSSRLVVEMSASLASECNEIKEYVTR